MKVIVFLFFSLLMFLLSGCLFDSDSDKIVGDYETIWIDIPQTRGISKGETIVPGYVSEIGHNANFIIAKQQEQLRKLIQRSEISVAGKTAVEKEEKRSIMEGRRILENEFGKSIRFKSIRELATSESGQIIRELKPVWLMSPLSVSDTLPLKTDYFDVVIYEQNKGVSNETLIRRYGATIDFWERSIDDASGIN